MTTPEKRKVGLSECSDIIDSRIDPNIKKLYINYKVTDDYNYEMQDLAILPSQHLKLKHYDIMDTFGFVPVLKFPYPFRSSSYVKTTT